jgi:hypothetical protein
MTTRTMLRLACSCISLVFVASTLGCSNTETPTEPTGTGRLGTLVINVAIDMPQVCMGSPTPQLAIYVDGEKKITAPTAGQYRIDLTAGSHSVGFWPTDQTKVIEIREGSASTIGMTFYWVCPAGN